MKKFYSDWAVYNGIDYRCVRYFDKIELFDALDEENKNVLYTVSLNLIEDEYTIMTKAILNGVEYTVFDIEEGIVIYKRFINDENFIRRKTEEFELIVQYKSHSKNGHSTYLEKSIIYINENKVTYDAVDRKYWPEEMASGNIMFCVDNELISLDDLYEALEKLYSGRISDKGSIPEAALFDEYIAWLSIDGIKFNISEDWGLVTISPEQNNVGGEYIRELIDYFNK